MKPKKNSHFQKDNFQLIIELSCKSLLIIIKKRGQAPSLFIIYKANIRFIIELRFAYLLFFYFKITEYNKHPLNSLLDLEL